MHDPGRSPSQAPHHENVLLAITTCRATLMSRKSSTAEPPSGPLTNVVRPGSRTSARAHAGSSVNTKK